MSNSSNRTDVSGVKEAMDKFKMEIANEIGIPLTNGHNGDLTPAQNGSIGGYMVKKMIESYGRQLAGEQILRY